MISGYASWDLIPQIGCEQLQRNFWPPLYVKQIAILFLPNQENDLQQSINDHLSYTMVTLGGYML
jgi:hypothetical protein